MKRKNMSISLPVILLEEIRLNAKLSGMNISDYVIHKMGLSTRVEILKGVSSTLCDRISPFSDGSYVSFVDGVYTTKRDITYRISVRGGLILYEIRVSMEDEKMRAKRSHPYTSRFFNESGRLICQVNHGDQLIRSVDEYWEMVETYDRERFLKGGKDNG